MIKPKYVHRPRQSQKVNRYLHKNHHPQRHTSNTDHPTLTKTMFAQAWQTWHILFQLRHIPTFSSTGAPPSRLHDLVHPHNATTCRHCGSLTMNPSLQSFRRQDLVWHSSTVQCMGGPPSERSCKQLHPKVIARHIPLGQNKRVIQHINACEKGWRCYHFVAPCIPTLVYVIPNPNGRLKSAMTFDVIHNTITTITIGCIGWGRHSYQPMRKTLGWR